MNQIQSAARLVRFALLSSVRSNMFPSVQPSHVQHPAASELGSNSLSISRWGRVALFSPFVKGLMCATLLRLGLSSWELLIRGPAQHHASTGLLFLNVPGLLALPLPFLLLTRSSAIARLAFGLLLLSAFVNATNPLMALITKLVPPLTTPDSLFYAFIHFFPCLIAILAAQRRAQTSEALT
jgi:hypothetical protein